MKGTEKILAHIRADAKSQADAVLAKAGEQAEQIRAEFDKQAAQVYAEKVRAGTKACQDQMDSVQRIANMEAKKSLLSVKQEMVSRSFEKAQELLIGLPAEKYTDFLAGLAARASVTGDEEIVLNERDRAAVGAAVVKATNEKLGGGRLSLSERVGSFAGGLILSRGNVEANCTVELLVELCRGEMSAEIADKLFA
ncbi:MAG: V-type ATP synthase subunit E [Oscillospiraceae bacterium]|nr:V-type ATP synthase subunit E [Oscillospiraceae bacterium]